MRSGNARVLILLGGLLAATIGVAAPLRARFALTGENVETSGQFAGVGQPAPPFSLRTLEGGPVSRDAFLGQPLLLSFWTTWCPSCREELQLLQQLQGEYRERGLAVLGVNVQESRHQVSRLLGELGLDLPVGLDVEGQVAASYRVRGFPTTVIVDSGGVVRAIHRGELTEETARGYLAQVLGP